MERLARVGDHTVIGASGDMSDWQAIQHQLNEMVTQESCNDDEHQMDPRHWYEYLAKWTYVRRSKSDPLWNYLVVGGYKDDKTYMK